MRRQKVDNTIICTPGGYNKANEQSYTDCKFFLIKNFEKRYNKLMTYSFWSPMKTIHFFRCL